MNKIEANLEDQRLLFIEHLRKCRHCKGFDHSAKAMTKLCWHGTEMFHLVLEAEDDYIKSVFDIRVNRSPQTLRQRAREEALHP